MTETVGRAEAVEVPVMAKAEEETRCRAPESGGSSLKAAAVGKEMETVVAARVQEMGGMEAAVAAMVASLHSEWAHLQQSSCSTRL